MKAINHSPKTQVGLVQINNSFSNQNYLPLSLGMLQAYAQANLAHADSYQFCLPIYRRMPVTAAVQQLLGVQIAFFSTYVWNFRISLEIARTLKAADPNVVIVFGGPQVPDRVEQFLTNYPFVDLACHGEGERSALKILENYPFRRWDQIPGISRMKEDGSVLQNPKGPRIDDLALVDSPYLSGVFEPLIKANPSENWIAMWETNRGCPFSCTFCDWGSATQSKVHTFELDRLYREVDWFAEHKIEFIFCCDANFGILPRDVDIANYVAETKQKRGYPNALSVQNTKNATERAYQTQRILADAGLNKGVDIALQSTDANTLKSIKRANISSETYYELQRRFSRDSVETYTDVILGLPGETYDSFANGITRIIENGQHNRIQFNNLSILPNAEMGDPEYQKRYGMRTVQSNTINIHGSLIQSQDEIFEMQELVVATDAMPESDWVKTRVFSWMAALLHFDKTLQVPLILIHEICGVSYRSLIEAFSEGSLERYPVLNEIQSLLVRQALDIQQGGPEYTRSEEWLNIWWPTDEYAVIKLCAENQLTQFYRESEQLLSDWLREQNLSLPSDLVHQAMALNQGLLKLPFQTEDLDLELDYNIWEFYRAVLTGRKIPLDNRPNRYHIDRTTNIWASWGEWCREVIWYGNKRGAYLYGNDSVEPQLTGHY